MKSLTWRESTILLACLCLATPAASEQDLTEMVATMREEGVIDDAQYAQLRDRAERRDAERGWRDFVSFSGDFRARFEHFWRSRDSAGGGREDRSRGRYRLRLGMEVDVNEHVDVVVRIASGANDSRSTNRSFGNGPGFDADELFIDRAYLSFTPFPGARPGGLDNDLTLRIGKQPLPFLWDHGVDYLLFDLELNAEGAALRDVLHLAEGVEVFANGGYFVLDENSTSGDPAMVGVQVGTHLDLSDTLRLGARGSYYNFNSLDSEFLARGVSGEAPPTTSAGNLEGGLTNRAVNVVEVGAYLLCSHLEQWPITLFGHWARNLAAERTLGLGSREDSAWMVGVDVGDKQAWLQLTVLYAALEADAFPSQLVDSDLFDGFTNRRGGAIYLARRVLERTDLSFGLLFSDAIRHGPAFSESVRDSDRVRLQADMTVAF